MGRKRKNNYIDSGKFKEAMNEFELLRSKNPDHKPSKYILESIMAIAKNHIKSPSFNTQHADLDAVIGEAIFSCVRALGNYTSKISENPFGYFSQICYYAYIGELQKQQKEFKGKVALVQRSTEFLDVIAEFEGNPSGGNKDTDDTINRLLMFNDQDISNPKNEKKKPTRKPLYFTKKEEGKPSSIKDLQEGENVPEKVEKPVGKSKKRSLI